MAVGGLSPTLPEAAEEEPASSGTAGVTFGTHFRGRSGNQSLSAWDQWGNLVWVVSQREERISHSSFQGCMLEGSLGKSRASASGYGMKETASRNGLLLVLTDTNGKD